MRQEALQKVIIIFAITLFALYIDLPRKVPINIHRGPINIDATIQRNDLNLHIGSFNFFRKLDLVLGLDLAGGSQLTFEADTKDLDQENKTSALTAAKQVVERRVNLFGVSEPNVQLSSFEGKDRIIVELPGVQDVQEAVNLIGETAQLEFAQFPESTASAQLRYTNLTGADLKQARVDFDPNTAKPVVSLEFTAEGGDKFSNITAETIGEPLAILLDGQIVSAPTVNEQISGGRAQISGEFTLEQARALAIQLTAGALPLSIELVEQRTVGATLGTESVEKSVQAGVVGLGMVLIFMVLAYKRLGLVAGVGLVIYGILTLCIYKLLPVVLTLPGVAGFLLSVGMAVDSNILIFERFKEEKGDRPVAEALEVSFGRAWDSIRDANIATLVTAFILANPLDWSFLQTSGPVRGFAITLALGIGISLFTGIVVTRNLLRLFITDKPNTQLT